MTQALRVMVRDSARDVRRNPMAWLAPLGILTGTFAALLAFTAVVESALLRSLSVDDRAAATSSDSCSCCPTG